MVICMNQECVLVSIRSIFTLPTLSENTTDLKVTLITMTLKMTLKVVASPLNNTFLFSSLPNKQKRLFFFKIKDESIENTNNNILKIQTLF